MIMDQPKPSIGRIVHYVSLGTPVREDGSQAFPSCCRAAIVTEVDGMNPYRVGLRVFNPTSDLTHPLVAGGLVLVAGGCTTGLTSEQGGSWHWPVHA